MTTRTVYVPVLIETAAQAEALPDGAIVIGVETGERYTRAFEGDWWGVTEMGTSLAVDLDSGDAVTALVPVEAEEEHKQAGGLSIAHGGTRTWPARTRYVTPWTEVDA